MAFEKVDIDGAKEDEKPKATKASDGEKAKKQNAAKQDTRPRTSRKPGPKTLEAKLVETSHGLSTLLIMAGQVEDGVILYSRSEQLCHAWSQAADQNKYVKQILTALTEGGVWGAVAISTASVGIPIMQNHGMFGNLPRVFALSEGEVNSLPPELQEMVAMYETMKAQAAERAANVNGAPAAGAPAHNVG